MPILASKKNDWCQLAHDVIEPILIKCIHDYSRCNFILTGGSSAKKLYQHWSQSLASYHNKINYFFGDERCVPPSHIDSNYGMAIKTLFPEGVISGCQVMRMKGEALDHEAEARRYEQELPENIDILLLSMGQDGHVASLFPYSNDLLDSSHLVIATNSNKHPHKRLTITPIVVRSAHSVFVFVCGREKGKLLATVFEEPDNFFQLPVRLTIDRVWLLDNDAADQYNKSVKSKDCLELQYV